MNIQSQLETLRGQGIEIVLATGESAIHYTIRGQGISDDAGIYPDDDRDALLVKLLSPLGLAERDGRIVEAA